MDDDNYRIGAYVIRGQEADPAVNVAPEHDTFKWTKLDPNKADDRAFVEDMWCVDKEIEIEGGKKVEVKEYNHKVCK